MEKVYDVAIIGAGGAGQMAMLRAVLNHLKTFVFLGDNITSKRSRATWVADVDNIPGMFYTKYPITKTSKEVIKFIEDHPDLKNFLTTIKEGAAQIRKDSDFFSITSKSKSIKARFVVLCTGTMDVQPKINGTIEDIFPYANRGDVLYCIRCDGHKIVGHTCSVIGNGDGAGWIAIMLKERYQNPQMTVLTNGEAFHSSEEVQSTLKKYGIKVNEGKIESIIGDPKKSLEGFMVNGQKVDSTKSFVALGSIVYNDLAKQLGVTLSQRDHIIVNQEGETNIAGFYAAGDLVEGKKKQVYTAWDCAVDAVDSIDRKIRILKRNGTYNLST